MAVVVAHATVVLRVDGLRAYWALPVGEQTASSLAIMATTAVLNPGSAVILFFVLSGYVLSISSTKYQFSEYLTKRVFRLLPPMWISILALAFLIFALPTQSSNVLSDWSANAFQAPTRDSILKNLALWEFRVNGVTWTMYVELVGSVFVFVSSRLGKKLDVLVLMFTVVLSRLLSPSLTSTYLLCFQAGVMVGRYTGRAPGFLSWAALLAFICDRLLLKGGFPSLMLNTLASACLIAAVTRGAGMRFFNARILRFVGRVSFSLYLYHPLVLCGICVFAANLAGPGLVPHILVLLIALPTSLLVSWIGYQLIERPSMELGKATAIRIRDALSAR